MTPHFQPSWSAVFSSLKFYHLDLVSDLVCEWSCDKLCTEKSETLSGLDAQ